MSVIRFNSFGSGKKTLVLFPGWTHPIQDEPIFLKEIQKYFKIVSVNLPGYINSKDGKTYQNFLILAKEIHAELQKEHINPSGFVGFSMGCRLISTYLALFPSEKPSVFIAYPTTQYTLPLWARVIVHNKIFLHLFRSNDTFKKLSVNMALQTIMQDSKAIFKPDSVTLLGAFDSLIGLITSDVHLDNHRKRDYFIYGEKDVYLPNAKEENLLNVKIIKGAGHNCVPNHEKEIVDFIAEVIKK